ncbi:MAG: metal-sensing transcriptional repressor [Acetatifactor sp.]|nr:metal-sensing transcriptional repressor [Acetatifactor sp.]
MEKEKSSCCCTPPEESADVGIEEMPFARTKDRSEKEYKDLLNRLSRIEGQIRGIRGMVEKGAYCTDILTQVAAATSALNSFNKVLLENHMKTCVTRDIKEGKEESLDEVLAILQKLMR